VSAPALLRTEDDGVVTLTLNRPAVHNALHPEQLRELAATLAELAGDPELRLLALTGAGEGAFSSGFDIEALRAGAPGERPSQVLFEVTAALADFPAPTLAAVRGYCYGAGLDLALSCDHRVATADARFALPAARLGTVYEPRSLARMQRLVAPAAAKRLAVCGQTLGAEEALRAGLVDSLVEPGDLAATVAGWVEAPAAGARAHKRILDALAAGPERPPGFWEPLDALRAASLDSGARRAALDDFATRGRG
jgi:enoyl-CoA hydratase/carnithine racemase